MKKYVFDLDNTLIYTDSLNNDSYNYALKYHGLQPIEGFSRITKDVVFSKYPNIDRNQRNEVVDLKGDYFINNLHQTKLNKTLVELLRAQKRDDCILWTSANENRARYLLDYYKMDKSFKHIIFSNKINIKKDIEQICKLHECEMEQLEIYDDNLMIIKELEKLNLNAILV